MSTARETLFSPSTDVTSHVLEELTKAYPHHDFAVRLWDGSVWGERHLPRFTLVLRHPDSLRRLLAAASELELGEAFIFESIDLEGDLEAAFEFADCLLNYRHSALEKVRLAKALFKLPRGNPHRLAIVPRISGILHSKRRDREAVTYHYDLPTSFYRLWLDHRLVYSCAYFKDGNESIDQAQENKLDYICRKLRLRAGERLLDIGCGWGGLIVYAAQKFGVHALGITLSQPQAEVAREQIEAAGLGGRCDVQVCDYRDLGPSLAFDKIVSVGMVEHVGESLLHLYFQQVWSLLKSGGMFLNHGIAASATFKRRGESFIDKYVFPDGELLPLHATLRAAEACGFEVRDVENLREHYARTLRHWVGRLESHYDEAVRLTNETVYRIWRLYMAGATYGFSSGRMNLCQVLLSKPRQGNTHLPLTRADWYA